MSNRRFIVQLFPTAEFANNAERWPSFLNDRTRGNTGWQAGKLMELELLNLEHLEALGGRHPLDAVPPSAVFRDAR